MRRTLAALGAAAALAGCNTAYSTEPVFTAADAAGAPALRDGLWAAPEPGCRFNASLPTQLWPHCVQPILVRGGEFLMLIEPEGEPVRWDSMPFVLAAGEPRILQFRSTYREDGQERVVYRFLAAEPVRTDEAGRVTALRRWFVLCGPLPPEPKHRKKSDPPRRWVTDKPFPGLTLEGDGCTPADAAAVRNAAAASRGLDDEPSEIRWVRDTLP
jgi:hypothetical protein